MFNRSRKSRDYTNLVTLLNDAAVADNDQKKIDDREEGAGTAW